MNLDVKYQHFRALELDGRDADFRCWHVDTRTGLEEDAVGHIELRGMHFLD